MGRGAALGVALALVAVTPATGVAAPTLLMRWKLAVDMRAYPNHRVLPSYRGGSAVWSLRRSLSLARDGNYSLLPTYSATFGAVGIKAWHGNTAKCVKVPAIGINTTHESLPLCAGHLPADAAFVYPGVARMAVVTWTSPFNGTVTISHNAVADVDATCGDGVSYYVDLGQTELVNARIAKPARHGCAHL